MEVLTSVKDKNDNPCKFTINNIVANPDFPKIKESNYEKYFYEPFPQTLQRYHRSDTVLQLYREGIASKALQPQFHGREHVHVSNWFKRLQSKDQAFLDAFDERMFTINIDKGNSCLEECLDAMATYEAHELEDTSRAVTEGLKLFSDIWGFASKSVIAPCYTWHSSLENTFKSNGVSFVQGARAQRSPVIGNNRKIIKRHYMGEQSPQGLKYLIRNVDFEQIERNNPAIVHTALKQIDIAFSLKKPAIISSHRVNYIGYIEESNRTSNLKLLKDLLQQIIRRYPDVEFMSSDELGAFMNKYS